MVNDRWRNDECRMEYEYEYEYGPRTKDEWMWMAVQTWRKPGRRYSGEVLDVFCDEMRWDEMRWDEIHLWINPKTKQMKINNWCNVLKNIYVTAITTATATAISIAALSNHCYVTLPARQRQRILQSICSIPSILNRLIIRSFVHASIISPKSVFPKCRPSFLNTILFSNHQLIS